MIAKCLVLIALFVPYSSFGNPGHGGPPRVCGNRPSPELVAGKPMSVAQIRAALELVAPFDPLRDGVWQINVIRGPLHPIIQFYSLTSDRKINVLLDWSARLREWRCEPLSTQLSSERSLSRGNRTRAIAAALAAMGDGPADSLDKERVTPGEWGPDGCHLVFNRRPYLAWHEVYFVVSSEYKVTYWGTTVEDGQFSPEAGHRKQNH